MARGPARVTVTSTAVNEQTLLKWKRKISEIECAHDLIDLAKKSNRHRNISRQSQPGDKDAYNIMRNYQTLRRKVRKVQSDISSMNEGNRILAGNHSSGGELNISIDVNGGGDGDGGSPTHGGHDVEMPESLQERQGNESSNEVSSDTENNGGFDVLDNSVNLTCINCFRSRSQYLSDLGCDVYNISFECQPRNSMKKKKLRNAHGSRNDTSSVILCYQCARYLETEHDFPIEGSLDQYAWPSFMWALLTNTSVHKILGINIWKFVPQLWRHWWIESLQILYPNTFRQISLEYPCSHFIDRTMHYNEIKNDIESMELARLKSAMDKFLIPDVLCPWGDSEYLMQCGHVPIDIVMQRYIPQTILKLIGTHSDMALIRSARDDYIRSSEEYDTLLFNPEWKVSPTIIFLCGKGPCVCTSRHSNGGLVKDFIHPPRQPNNHILPSAIPSQVSHVVPKPQTLKPMVAHQFSNSYQMHEQTGSFQGVSSIGAVDVGNFSSCSVLLDEYESRSITFRADINSHLEKLYAEKILTREAVDLKRERAKQLFSEPSNYEKYVHGSTYVSLEDSVATQKFIGSENLIDVIWDRRGHDTNGDDLPEMSYRCRRSWPPHIFLCQKLDLERYGERFPMLPTFKANTTSHQILFMISALLTSTKELWCLTDEISPKRQSEWDGWTLAYLTSKCFPHVTCPRDKRNPFKKSLASITSDIAKHFDNESMNHTSLSLLFNRHEKVGFYDNLDYLSLTEVGNNDVLVFNGLNLLNDEHHLDEFLHVGDDAFELRVAITMEEQVERGQQKWIGNVYARHGGIHLSWWKYSSKASERFPIKISQTCFSNADFTSLSCAVYVKVKKVDLESLRNQFQTYIGGQNHIQCGVHSLPLICAHPRHNMCSCCGNKKETLCCPDLHCDICVCKQCSEQYDERIISFIHSGEGQMVAEEEQDGDDFDEDGFTNDDGDNDEEMEDDDATHFDDAMLEEPLEEPYREDMEDGDDDDYLNYFNAHDIEASDELAFDNYLINGGDAFDDGGCDENDDQNELLIPTTNAGSIRMEVEQKKGIGSYISGHVILNQCGSLLSRVKDKIRGFTGQKNFLQRLCSTSRGESIPLAFPDAMVFSSLFWYMIPDVGSYPGALPASLLNEKTGLHGIASIRDHVQNRLTLPFSGTSTDTRYIAFLYDMLSNLTMCHNDSRIVLNRGFTVDQNSATGLGVRSKKDSSLFDSIDSKQMVKNLSASQKYHHMDFFLTFTCNQKKHFGIAPLKNWIDSTEWERYYPDFHNLNDDEKHEIRIAVYQAAGPLILRNWLEVRKYFIEYLLRSPSSPYIDVDALFARDEYQAEVGNLPHIHLMLSINWDNLNDSQKKSVNDLI